MDNICTQEEKLKTIKYAKKRMGMKNTPHAPCGCNKNSYGLSSRLWTRRGPVTIFIASNSVAISPSVVQHIKNVWQYIRIA